MVYHNETLEESIHYVGAPVTEGDLYNGQVWGDDGIDPRKLANHHRYGPKLPSVRPSIVTNLTLLEYFLILFHMDYVKGTMIPGTTQSLPRELITCQIMSSSSGWGCGWLWDATKETGVSEIGGQRTIFKLGEKPPSASTSTWAV